MKGKQALIKIGFLTLLTALFLIIPHLASADNYITGYYSINGETVISKEKKSGMAYYVTLSTTYDAQDHGFKFYCESVDIYGKSYDYTKSATIYECSVVNDKGETVEYTLQSDVSPKKLILTKPEAGTYTIKLKASWIWYGSERNSESYITFIVEKANLADFFSVSGYSGTYDGQYHDAIEITCNEDFSNYNASFKTLISDDYSTLLPMVKGTNDSGTYSCKISTESDSFIEKECLFTTEAVVNRKPITVTVSDAIKCSGISDPSFDYSSDGAIDELQDITIVRESGETPGTYLLTPSQPATANPNYQISFRTGTLTIRQHDWDTVNYSWNRDYSTVTATRICSHDSNHKETETAQTTIIEIDPTCTSSGKKVYTTKSFSNPAFSKQSKTIITAQSLGHDWSDPVYVWQSDYSSVTASRYCYNDQNHYQEETVETTSLITTPATCTAMGKTTYTTNAFTNDAFSEQTKTVRNVKATGHNWSSVTYIWDSDYSKVTATRTCINNSTHNETETVDANEESIVPSTCINNGSITYSSEDFENVNFDAQSKTIQLPLAGHTKVVDIAAVESSCSRTGNTEKSHCRICGTTLSEYSVIQKKPHTIVSDGAVAATCTTTGLTEGSHCSVCGEVLVEQTVTPILGHTKYVDIAAVAATCTESGSTEQSHCSKCGIIISSRETIPPKGHSTVIDSAVEATCTANGLTQGSHCSRCGTVINPQTVIPAKGHTKVVDSPSVAATCTETGLTERSHCKVCGETISEQTIIDALGHKKIVDIPAEDATCEKNGFTEQSHCETCGIVISERTSIPAAHSIVIDPYVRPTAHTDGLTEGSHCEKCGLVIKQQQIIERTAPSFTTDLSACLKAIIPEGFVPYYTSDTWYGNQKKYYSVDDESCTITIIKQSSSSWNVSDVLDEFRNKGYFADYSRLVMGEVYVYGNINLNKQGIEYFKDFWYSGVRYTIYYTGYGMQAESLAIIAFKENSIHLKHSSPTVSAITIASVNGDIAYDGYIGEITCRSCGALLQDEQQYFYSSSLNLPAGITRIEEEAFYGTKAAQVIIPEGCKYIGKNAFTYGNLCLIVIPSSVEFIDDLALYRYTEVSGSAYYAPVIVVDSPSSYAAQWAKERGYCVYYQQ